MLTSWGLGHQAAYPISWNTVCSMSVTIGTTLTFLLCMYLVVLYYSNSSVLFDEQRLTLFLTEYPLHEYCYHTHNLMLLSCLVSVVCACYGMCLYRGWQQTILVVRLFSLFAMETHVMISGVCSLLSEHAVTFR